MEGVLEQLARQVEHRLVELNVRGRTLTLKVRWSNFQLVTRSVSRAQGFQDAQAMVPSQAADPARWWEQAGASAGRHGIQPADQQRGAANRADDCAYPVGHGVIP